MEIVQIYSQQTQKLREIDEISITVNWITSCFHVFAYKIFRQINYLVGNLFSKNVVFTKFLPKKCESKFPIGLLPNYARAMKYVLLISRKKSQKSRMISSIVAKNTVRNLQDFTHKMLWRKFREINFFPALIKNINWFHETFFKWE